MNAVPNKVDIYRIRVRASNCQKIFRSSCYEHRSSVQFLLIYWLAMSHSIFS